MFVVIARWEAKPGEEEAVANVLRTMTPLTRAEPGCRMYIAHRSTEDPRSFLIYEQYEDEAALQAHRESEHFKVHVLRDGVNRLAQRDAAFYEFLD